MNKGKEEITHLSIIRTNLEQSTKWFDLPAIMSDHNTRLSATERLEEAVSRLTQNQATLTQSHFAMKEEHEKEKQKEKEEIEKENNQKNEK